MKVRVVKRNGWYCPEFRYWLSWEPFTNHKGISIQCRYLAEAVDFLEAERTRRDTGPIVLHEGEI